MKINWKQKLTSRKFWAAVVGFVTTLLVAFGYNQLQIAQVAAIITAAATLIAYIIGEGLVDARRACAPDSREACRTGDSREQSPLLSGDMQPERPADEITEQRGVKSNVE